MSTITTRTTVTVEVPVGAYSHNEATQIFENFRSELFGTDAMHMHRDDEAEWEASFVLPTPFDGEAYADMHRIYVDRYPEILITASPVPVDMR